MITLEKLKNFVDINFIMLNDKDFRTFIDIFRLLITSFTWLKLYPKRKSQIPSVSYICYRVFYVCSCFKINVICFIWTKVARIMHMHKMVVHFLQILQKHKHPSNNL